MEPQALGKPWTIDMPIDVPQGEIDSFIEHFHEALKDSRNSNVVPCVEGVIRVEEEETPEATLRRLRFIYRLEHRSLGPRSTFNELVATRKKGENAYSVKMTSVGEDRMIYDTATFIRKLVLGWSVEKKRRTPA